MSSHWTTDEISQLKRAVRAVDERLEKQLRWTKIAEHLNISKYKKRDCFNCYRELKVIRNAAKIVTKEVTRVVASEEEVVVIESLSEEKENKLPEPIIAIDMKKILRQLMKDPALSSAFRNPVMGPLTKVILKDPSCLSDPETFFEDELAASPELRALADEFLPKLAAFIAELSKPKEKELKKESEKEPEIEKEEKEKVEEADQDRPSEADNLTKEEEANLSDLSDFDADQPSSSEALTRDEGLSIRKLVFGDPALVFNPAWRKQGFFFTKEDEELGYGLVQTDGGPCGVVAAVQAFVLRFLLFGAVENIETTIIDAKEGWRKPSKKEQKAAVVNAVARMIWGCSVSGVGTGEDYCKVEKKRPAKVAFPAGDDKARIAKAKDFKHDGITEKLMVTTCYNFADCLDVVKSNAGFLMKKDQGGVVCVVISCLLSRGLDTVGTDMDSNFGIAPKMIGNHGYAAQEMVNLFLTGVASSNMFDGEKRLEDDTGAGSGDCVVMGGVPLRSDVGFLTLFEAFGNVSVGDNFKVPRCPIWVVCSESHYSTLFSPLAKHVEEYDEKAYGEDRDIFYYDPLGEQEGEIKLTLDFKPEKEVALGGGSEDDLTPPINKVIRTKWPGTAVDWNGSDEIL